MIASGRLAQTAAAALVCCKACRPCVATNLLTLGVAAAGAFASRFVARRR